MSNCYFLIVDINLTNRKWIEGNTVENLIESNNSFSNVIFLAFLRRNI